MFSETLAGTLSGTGYNSAILAYIVGAKNVVSVDINEELLNVARMRIEQVVGPGVTVIHADGRNLPEDLIDFDAIIVTGGHDRIEPSWIRALAPGGKFIFNWLQSFTKVMIEAEKHTSGGMIGRVCEYGGAFMSLHDGNGVRPAVLPYEKLDIIENLAFQSQLFDNPDFRFFLQINMPSLQHYHYNNPKGARVYVIKEVKSARVIHVFPQVICGDASLWREIHSLYEKFEQCSQPSRATYSLCVDKSGIMQFTHEACSKQQIS
jgi:SAM-dependent methyltransferase